MSRYYVFVLFIHVVVVCTHIVYTFFWWWMKNSNKSWSIVVKNRWYKCNIFSNKYDIWGIVFCIFLDLFMWICLCVCMLCYTQKKWKGFSIVINLELLLVSSWRGCWPFHSKIVDLEFHSDKNILIKKGCVSCLAHERKELIFCVKVVQHFFSCIDFQRLTQ